MTTILYHSDALLIRQCNSLSYQFQQVLITALQVNKLLTGFPSDWYGFVENHSSCSSHLTLKKYGYWVRSLLKKSLYTTIIIIFVSKPLIHIILIKLVRTSWVAKSLMSMSVSLSRELYMYSSSVNPKKVSKVGLPWLNAKHNYYYEDCSICCMHVACTLEQHREQENC